MWTLLHPNPCTSLLLIFILFCHCSLAFLLWPHSSLVRLPRLLSSSLFPSLVLSISSTFEKFSLLLSSVLHSSFSLLLVPYLTDFPPSLPRHLSSSFPQLLSIQSFLYTNPPSLNPRFFPPQLSSLPLSSLSFSSNTPFLLYPPITKRLLEKV